MSRSAAAPADHRRAAPARGHAPAVPRRVSGPLRPPRAAVDARSLAVSDGALAPSPLPRPQRPRTPSRPPLRLAAGGAAIALRVAEATLEVSGSRTMDRLVRSRAWVVIVAFGLIGIVAMQVSMLKFNAGIGRAVETAATLERNNAALRADVSRLSSGDRIQALAGARGFVMPEPGDVTYLRAGGLGAEGVRAAQRMHAPDPQIAGPAGAVSAASITPAITGPGDPGAPSVTATATDPATATNPAAATTGPLATTAATVTAPATTPPASTPPPATTAVTGAAAAPVAPAATAAPGLAYDGASIP
jgi:cell division protein FtsB